MGKSGKIILSSDKRNKSYTTFGVKKSTAPITKDIHRYFIGGESKMIYELFDENNIDFHKIKNWSSKNSKYHKNKKIRNKEEGLDNMQSLDQSLDDIIEETVVIKEVPDISKADLLVKCLLDIKEAHEMLKQILTTMKNIL